ncbi:MAG: phosphoesterase [Proteobacteria bacterium]|nr:phosphoesterase [Pseudomonadota bacterium]MCP4918674.1 phosphoesterase [Pseudomonadota bacterium]
MKRRTVLGGGAAGLVAAALPGCSKDEEDTGPAREAGIDHVIVVMMENRSFDHYLGSLKALEGRDVEGLSGTESNPGPDGNPVTVFQLTEPCQEDPPHGWGSSHNQFSEGTNQGFVLEHFDRVGPEQGDWVMGYYTRDELPIHYALADHFCLPDRYFCSVMGPTWPNRLFGQSASSDGQTSNNIDAAPFTQKTIFEAVAEGGREWRYYYTDIPFIGLYEDHWQTDNIAFLEDFIADAEAGDLADFTWIDPGFGFNDDHPPHHPGLGQMFLALVYEAIARSPAWDRTLLIITYDEHGGFHDHVPPPQVADERADEGFDQLGFRVPALICGPWVKQGTVSTVFDNTSMLRLTCELFDLELWNERLQGINSLEDCIDRDRMARNEPLAPAVMPTFSVPEDEVEAACQYEGLRTGFASSQPALEAWVMANMPENSRVHQAEEIRLRLLAKSVEYGLVES